MFRSTCTCKLGGTKISKFAMEVFFANLRSWKRVQHFHNCPSWPAHTANSFILNRHGLKLTSGLSPDSGLWRICNTNILGQSFKRIQTVGKRWIIRMWWIRDQVPPASPQLPPASAEANHGWNLGQHITLGWWNAIQPTCQLLSDHTRDWFTDKSVSSTGKLRCVWWPYPSGTFRSQVAEIQTAFWKMPPRWGLLSPTSVARAAPYTGEGTISEWQLHKTLQQHFSNSNLESQL